MLSALLGRDRALLFTCRVLKGRIRMDTKVVYLSEVFDWLFSTFPSCCVSSMDVHALPPAGLEVDGGVFGAREGVGGDHRQAPPRIAADQGGGERKKRGTF